MYTGITTAKMCMCVRCQDILPAVLTSQILDALYFIHQPRERIRFVHRDLKPSNIFFARGREEFLKIGDFGLVKGNALIEPTGNYKDTLYQGFPTH